MPDSLWVDTSVIKMHDNPPPESQWRYAVVMPKWLSEWDVFANWEKARFLSMEAELDRGDVLIDIGTELGWQSIIYAKFVGEENMVLVEPAREFWPNIMQIWRQNFDKAPLACCSNLFSDKTTSNWTLGKGLFPAEAEGMPVDKVAYRYIHEHGNRMPQMKVDDYCRLAKIKPNALTIDTEGSELLILRGAEKVLKRYDLKVWVSVHPDMALADYSIEPNAIFEFMDSCGYDASHLGTDHEEHWYFKKRKKAKK